MIRKVIEIVRQAGSLMQNRDFTVTSKGSISDNVTSVDYSIQEYLKERLVPLIDGCVFVGEENYNEELLKTNSCRWIVDPIDGTANFIRDLALSVISVALVKDGSPVLGVVYNPFRDEMFYAEEGKGAFLNDEPIKVSDRSFERSMFCTAFSLYNKDYAKPCINILEKVYAESEDMRRLGAVALELVYLACGRVDLLFEMRVFPWDFAASEVIVREAGGYIGTIGSEKTTFSRPIPLICANTKENYDHLRSIILEEIPTVLYTE